jgi:hypothetical protein
LAGALLEVLRQLQRRRRVVVLTVADEVLVERVGGNAGARVGEVTRSLAASSSRTKRSIALWSFMTTGAELK